MRKMFVAILAMVVISGAMAQTQAKTEKVSGPKIAFEKSTHDFGDIFQGDRVEHVFKFKNTGNDHLMLTNVQVTCGCTVPDWPRDPIAPGQSAEITVAFNSAGKMGRQNKTITVISNAVNDYEVVTIVTNILPKKTK
jgi:hypothetical protein